MQRVACTEAMPAQVIGHSLQSEVPSSDSDSDSTDYSIGDISLFSESEKSEDNYDSDNTQEVDIADEDFDDMNGVENHEGNISTSKPVNL